MERIFNDWRDTSHRKGSRKTYDTSRRMGTGIYKKKEKRINMVKMINSSLGNNNQIPQ